MPKAPSELQDKYIVRFPDGMRDRIAEAAKANGRSMNAEIVARLAQSLADDVMKAAVVLSLDDLRELSLQVVEEIERRKARGEVPPN